jgi:hypothetical protein
MDKFISSIQAVKVPENLDLTTDELNAIKSKAAGLFDIIQIAFQCGFMRGQSAAADDFKMGMEPVKDRAQSHKGLDLICEALDGIMENGCEPAQFVPALYGVDLDMVCLKRDMAIALGAEG